MEIVLSQNGNLMKNDKGKLAALNSNDVKITLRGLNNLKMVLSL